MEVTFSKYLGNLDSNAGKQKGSLQLCVHNDIS